MKLLVFGANGRVGSLAVEKALAKGHYVIAFVHGESRFKDHPNLEIFKGDIYDRSSVEAAVVKAEIVVSALGSWGTPKKNVLTVAMQHSIPAMENRGIKRIVSLTGHDARAKGDTLYPLHKLTHTMLKLVAPKILIDGEAHIRLLENSSLSWTVLRSPIMNEQGRQKYCLGSNRPEAWHTINRHAVARAMVDQISATNFIRSAPYLTRG